jgi:3-dehydroquinate synthetase
MNGNLYLTGFMGAGKSSVGRELAQVLRRPFVDLDEAIARRLGMPITQAFASLGEQAFRVAERRELERAARRQRLVVAVGGGAPESAENRRLMRASGRMMHLDASLDACRGRLDPAETARRPLWADEKALAALYERRRPIYADCDFNVLTDGLGPHAVVEALCARLMPEERFEVRLGAAQCPVVATWRGPAALAEILPELLGERRTALLSDRRVAVLHAERYGLALGGPAQVIVPAGEGSKSLMASGRVYQALLDAHIERGDLLVALGGGMVTDLGAYVAATYKRGMDFALVSTSLLGCVDAAVGGKAALNLGQAKNMIGLFTVPKAVVLDLRALSTVPRAQMAEGLVEAYKTGLVADPGLAELIESSLAACRAGDLMLMAEAATRSARAKAKVVSEDFREADLRRILNLGHTYGHAVEGLNRYRVSHGRAVAVGTLVATALSAGRGLMSPEMAQRISDTVAGIVKVDFAWPAVEDAWPIMAHDKKNQGGQVIFVLLREAGQPVLVADVTPDELGRAIVRAKGE